MTFSESLETCFKKYSQGRGRASRSEYWYFYLFSVVVNLTLSIMVTVSNNSTPVTLFADLIDLVIVVPMITAAVRRFHDTSRSAWNLLWALLPIIGWIIEIVYLTQSGTIGSNNYGDAEA